MRGWRAASGWRRIMVGCKDAAAGDFFLLVKEALEGAWEKKKVDEGEAREDEV